MHGQICHSGSLESLILGSSHCIHPSGLLCIRAYHAVHLLAAQTDIKELTRSGFATGSSSSFTRPFDGTMTKGIGVVAACMTALAPSEVGACRLRMSQRTGEGRREFA